MKDDRIEVFSCYSPPLKKFLIEEKSLRYIVTGLNRHDHRRFWTFIKTDSLNEALAEWHEIKQC